MRVVVALGGNAIARRGQPFTVEEQRANIRTACGPLLDAAVNHELVITHGNGPQVGMLALRHGPAGSQDMPLDVLGAETQGMIGYLIESELRNALVAREEQQRMITTVLTLVEVALDDPAFARPTKFVGPVYEPQQARELVAEQHWVFADDGGAPRRVVPSPRPTRVVQVDSTKRLLEAGHIVICVGGGGIPIARDASGHFVGVEAVVDKDASSALFAAEIDAGVLVMATDADAVMFDWGTPRQRAVRTVNAAELAGHHFAAGSMGPKVAAACEFVSRTGARAVIGRLSRLDELLAGTAGTTIVAGDRAMQLYRRFFGRPGNHDRAPQPGRPE